MSNTCEDISPLYWTGWVIFFITSIACLIFGSRRGSQLKIFNFVAVSLALWFGSIWYGAGAISSFCTIDSVNNPPGNLDFSLTRILSFATLSTVCGILVTVWLNESSLYSIVYVIVSIASQVFITVSIIVDRNRIFWAGSGMWFSALILIGIWTSSNSKHSKRPRFCFAILWSFVIYVLLYYVILLFGPWYSNIFSLLAQEIILTISDVLFGLRILYLSIHYSWAEGITSPENLKPGYISNSNDSESIIDELHSI